MAQRLVVIGAGMAAGRLLEHLTTDAPGAFDITLFNAEPRGTYNRLMLSPVLAGEKTYAQIVTHDDDWYAAQNVTCRFGERVLEIDRDRKVVVGKQGEVAYDKLVIATGSTPFIIPMPGHDLPGVIAYRDLEDTEQMIALAAMPDARAVVIGGGVLGLEAAAGMAAQGIDVTVVHIAGHVMERQLDPVAGGMLAADLRARGITVLCEAQSDHIAAGSDGRARALVMKDGSELPFDLLVMAVGIRPNVGLARDAGLEMGRALIVDDQLRTSDADVFGLGECVEHNGALFGLVAPLYDQARVLADTLMGKPAVFVNHEVSTKLKVTGCDLFSAGDFAGGEGRDEIVMNDPAAKRYRRLVLEGDRLIGAVMYGDTADGLWFYDLIRDHTDVCDLRDGLIFGPDAVVDPTSLPMDALGSTPALPDLSQPRTRSAA